MIGTLCSQFLSALGDNALLFAALALVHREGFPAVNAIAVGFGLALALSMGILTAAERFKVGRS